MDLHANFIKNEKGFFPKCKYFLYNIRFNYWMTSAFKIFLTAVQIIVSDTGIKAIYGYRKQKIVVETITSL